MFNSKRLTVARQRHSLTKAELAKKIGIEPRSISGFEGREYEPAEETIEKIVRVLHFPKAFFLADDIDVPNESGVSFRSMSKMSARQRDSAIAAGSLAFILSDWVDTEFNLPSPDLAQACTPDSLGR
jgi:transcriptional regulator with XRE-family HTH domain